MVPYTQTDMAKIFHSRRSKGRGVQGEPPAQLFPGKEQELRPGQPKQRLHGQGDKNYVLCPEHTG